MKKVEIYVSESGIPLNTPDEGFIVYGDIYKADNVSGLIGNGAARSNSEHINELSPSAYTVEEFLDALCIPLSVLNDYVAKKNPTIRTPNLSQGKTTQQDITSVKDYTSESYWGGARS
jgi:hypothetical protein